MARLMLPGEHADFSVSHPTVKRLVRKLRRNQLVQARAVIVTAPGEEAQVDNGNKDPGAGGEISAHSAVRQDPRFRRKAVRLLTFRSSSRVWAELHEKAFRRLGGNTRVVVLDDFKESVLVPDVYDPTVNPLYRDVLAHYGAVARPSRASR